MNDDYIYQHGDDALIIPENNRYVVAHRIDRDDHGNWFWAITEKTFNTVAEARAAIDADALN
jgi:hypothetical protein